MQLTTPEALTYDPVFPSESWFLYWKTSPSLWEQKLRNYRGHRPLLVPIYWGLHGEFKGQVDFGDYKSEANLERLCTLIQFLGIDARFLIPISPIPFLPNGSIPAYLVKHVALDREGRAQLFLSGEDEVHKIFSFFDPMVYRGLSFFLAELKKFLNTKKIQIPIYGLESFTFFENRLETTFTDRSNVFFKGFKQYLKELGAEGEGVDLSESNAQKKYQIEIRKLYSDLLGTTFENLFNGIMKVGFIGSEFNEVFDRGILDNGDNHKHSEEYFYCISRGILPSTIMLRKPKLVGENWNAHNDCFFEALINKESEELFRPLSLIDIVYFEDSSVGKSLSFVSSGLERYFKKSFHGAVQFKKYSKDLSFNQWSLVIGDCEPNDFRGVLSKLFSGISLLIDSANLSTENKQILEGFIAENTFRREEIQFITHVERISLGESCLFLFDSTKLNEVDPERQDVFWNRLLNYDHFHFINLTGHEQLAFFALEKKNMEKKLGFKKIRRYFFYNPSDYKQEVKITKHKGQAFIKSLNARGVHVQSEHMLIHLTFEAQAYISLDFGVYDEH